MRYAMNFISYLSVMSFNMKHLQDGRTPLHWAASSGALDIVTYLLTHEAEVDKTDPSGWTALHIAGMFVIHIIRTVC